MMPNTGSANVSNMPSQPMQQPGTIPEGGVGSDPYSQPQQMQMGGQVPIQQQPLFAQPQPVISQEMVALSLNPQFQMIKVQVQQNPASLQY